MPLKALQCVNSSCNLLHSDVRQLIDSRPLLWTSDPSQHSTCVRTRSGTTFSSWPLSWPFSPWGRWVAAPVASSPHDCTRRRCQDPRSRTPTCVTQSSRRECACCRVAAATRGILGTAIRKQYERNRCDEIIRYCAECMRFQSQANLCTGKIVSV